MKHKGIIMATLLLLAVLTMGAVSAEDNITVETMAVDEKTIENSFDDSLELSESFDDELKGEDVNLVVTHKDVMTKDDSFGISSLDYDGRISVLVDGKEVYYDDSFYFGLVQMDELPDIGYGNHSIEVKYLGGRDSNLYNPTSYKSSFIFSYVEVIAYSDGLEISSEVEMGAKLYLDGDLVYQGNLDEYEKIYSEKLFSGYIPNYTLITSGKGKYAAITLTGPLYYDVYPEIQVPETMGKGEDKYIKFELPRDANGNLTVYLNGIELNASFENGKSSIPLNTLEIGDYDVHIVYDSDSKYESYDRDYYNIKVTRNPNFNITMPSVCYALGSTITFTASDEIEGTISISTEIDTVFEGNFKNGVAKISISDDDLGFKTLPYTFKGTYMGEELEYNGEFNITFVCLSASFPQTVYAGKSFKVILEGPKDVKGTVDCYETEDITFNLKNGKATLTINPLKAGIRTVKYSFYAEKYDYNFLSSFKVNVIKPPIISAKDFKKDYTSKSKYKVRILDNQSRPLGAGKKVTFYLYADGKKVATKTAKTDKNGYAEVDFNVVPNSYKVKISHGPATLTKKYTVNAIVKIKEIHKYKKFRPGLAQWVTSNKFEFGATLKVDGKYLKGKKVKMTFYRQDYKGKIKDKYWGRLSKLKSLTLKTNSKGVCKKTYKNLPFKVTKSELEGLIILVQVSYLNEIHWVDLNVHSLSPARYYFLTSF